MEKKNDNSYILTSLLRLIKHATMLLKEIWKRSSNVFRKVK